MKEQLMNGIMPVLTQGILAIMGILITTLTAVAVSYLQKKKQALITKIGVEEYNKNYRLAKDIYFAVEQRFKGYDFSAAKKRKEFDKLLIKAIPYLKQSDLDHFREAVCGEVNTQIKTSNVLNPVKEINSTETITNNID